MPHSETRLLAEWIATMRLDDVPSEVVQHAKTCILDSIGCMIAGSATPACVTILNVLGRHGAGDTIVPGSGKTLALPSAAYLNAQAANALDFDDSFRSGAPSHPGATVVPPALAIGQDRSAAGDDFIRAVIAGYEVSLRIGRAVQPSPERKQAVYGFSTWQIFGAVSAACSLLGLSADQVVNALGLAAVHAPVPSLRKLGTGEPPPYPWIKNTYGAASEMGLLAALLAAEGYVGSRSIFEGDQGFWIMSGSDRYRPELMTEGLGRDWLLRDVGFKHYGCCRWTHTMLDALHDCAGNAKPADIQSVDVYGFKELYQLQGNPPGSVIDAQFHAPHVAALELLGRSPAQGLFESDLSDPQVATLRDKVGLHHEPAADEPYYQRGVLPVRVVVRLRNGSERSVFRENPTGSAAAGGYPREAIEAKYLRLSSSALGQQRAASSMAALSDIENRPLSAVLPLIA
ncbi:MAG TPA: MmgE/PrpD family protein [Rhizobiaceae bacterium]|nr:MmgE/PrpD family protein [Rhizobiaceae bacterium]